MSKVVTVSEMHRLEEESAKTGVGAAQLMENAGRAVAQSVRRKLGTVAAKRVIVLVGPGNNGGDGLVAARYLYEEGASVSVFLASVRHDDDHNLMMIRDKGVTVMGSDISRIDGMLASADAVIDALFGTGQSRGIDGVYKEVLERLGHVKRCRPAIKIFAVDLPTGLNADTGQPDQVTPFVDYTLTLGLPKRGLYTPEGAARAGEVVVLDIGLATHLKTDLSAELITAELARGLLPVRSPYAHKGSFGRVMAIAGSANYYGAAYLACAGAARVGSGLVALAAPEGIIPAIAAKIPEITYIPLPDSTMGADIEDVAVLANHAREYDTILIGPGLGQRASGEFMKRLLALLPPLPLVLDADALNALAKMSKWWQDADFEAIITPHPGEMARLTGLNIGEVQASRIALAQEKATLWGKTVILKGAYTVVASPDGRCRISPFANAALASAGTGDVLAGAVVGLLGQGLSLFDAASLGVYIHARAGERAKAQIGEVGMLASDMLAELPRAIQELLEHK